MENVSKGTSTGIAMKGSTVTALESKGKGKVQLYNNTSFRTEEGGCGLVT